MLNTQSRQLERIYQSTVPGQVKDQPDLSLIDQMPIRFHDRFNAELIVESKNVFVAERARLRDYSNLLEMVRKGFFQQQNYVNQLEAGSEVKPIKRKHERDLLERIKFTCASLQDEIAQARIDVVAARVDCLKIMAMAYRAEDRLGHAEEPRLLALASQLDKIRNAIEAGEALPYPLPEALRD
jgi:hypothetical protein